jgi:hypothetical protein
MVGTVSDYPALLGRNKVIEVLGRLVVELADGTKWENDRLDLFLQALSALIEDIDGAYDNAKTPAPSDPWEVVAQALLGARYYE